MSRNCGRLTPASSLKSTALLRDSNSSSRTRPVGGHRHLRSPPIPRRFGPAQQVTAYQAVDGLAGGGVADAEEGGHIPNREVALAVHQAQQLQLGEGEAVAGHFFEFARPAPPWEAVEKTLALARRSFMASRASARPTTDYPPL